MMSSTSSKYLAVAGYFSLVLLFHTASNGVAGQVINFITDTLQTNVAGEPLIHETTEWDFDPYVSQKRRALFYETHGFRAARFVERIGLGIDGHEDERRYYQRLRDVGHLNGAHNYNFPPPA